MGFNKAKRSVARQDATSLGSHRPLARSEGLVIEELGDELLIYDLDIKHAHCLTPTAARVWKSCDGETARDELATLLSVDADEVTRALDELDSCDLLAQSPVLGGNEHTRRDFGFKVAKVSAAAAALPMVLSIAAPAAAQSQSVIELCIALAPGGTNNCNVCNQPTGNNTPCCCCHDPTIFPPDIGIDPPIAANEKLCSPTGDFCCTALGGSHCTEAGTGVEIDHDC